MYADVEITPYPLFRTSLEVMSASTLGTIIPMMDLDPTVTLGSFLMA